MRETKKIRLRHGISYVLGFNICGFCKFTMLHKYLQGVKALKK